MIVIFLTTIGFLIKLKRKAHVPYHHGIKYPAPGASLPDTYRYSAHDRYRYFRKWKIMR
jgi:hypothetical protein